MRRRRHILPMMGGALLVVLLVFAPMVLRIEKGAISRGEDSYTIGEEQKLVVYTSHKKEVYEPIIQEFEARTGIWVEVKTGGTIELMETIASEAGENSGDVMFGGGVESYQAYRDSFEGYRCSDSGSLKDDFYSEKGWWTPFSALPVVIIYNYKLVSQEEAPGTWEELLKKEWKGRIAFADPQTSGTSCTALLTMCQVMKMEPRQLAECFMKQLDGKVLEDSGLVTANVKEGTSPVGVTLEESARKAIEQGADISIIYPEDGTSAVPDGTAIIKHAPHSENARLFLDFTVSRDVQRLLGDKLGRRSVRTDIGVGEGFPKIAPMDFDLYWAGAHQRELLGWWKEQDNQGVLP